MEDVFVRISGKLVKLYGEFLKIPIWLRDEGEHWLRVLAAGGAYPDRQLSRDIFKMQREYSFPTTLVGVLSESGRVERASGIYRFVSRLFNLSGNYLLGGELIANGKFDTNLTGWTGDGGGTISLDNGRMKLTNASFGYGSSRYTMTTVVGKKYFLSADFEYGNCNAQIVVYTGTDQNNNRVFASSIFNTSTQITGEFVATQTTTRFSVFNPNNVNAGYSFWDNITVKEVLSGTNTDVTQATANSQPYLFKKGIKNPNGGTRFMTHPTISFAANQAWSVSTMLNCNTDGTNVQNYAGGGTNTTLRFRHGPVAYPTHGISFVNESNTVYSSIADYRGFIGKRLLLTYVADGLGNLKLYGNGVLLNSISAVTNATFSALLSYNNSANRPYNGNINYHFIRSGTLTPEQITAEYNLLSSYFPEISTVQVGSKHIATDNCEMVATPKGNVISLNNLAANTERVAPYDFNNWIAFGASTINDNDTYTTTANGGVVKNNILTIGRWYKALVSGSTTSSIFSIRESDTGGANSVIIGNAFGEYYWLATKNSIYLRNEGVGVTNVDILSVEEVGFTGAADLYTAIYNQTSGTVAQKTLAALKAAAMWRSPDSDLDKQAVFGKIFNKYAAKLMKVDIDTYNTENPTATWGYHVMTRSEAQALDVLDADTLKAAGTDLWTTANGTNTTGLDVYGAGVINANGTYSDFKGKARLMTDDDYALDINDDGTSTEIAVTTEGGSLRLVKD